MEGKYGWSEALRDGGTATVTVGVGEGYTLRRFQRRFRVASRAAFQRGLVLALGGG
ncbi:MAG: hypothetical protein KatS3mg077_0498 [Candidatus Binatia bacterium]|nr:MAG: hypothetical protein KatS3mg077_0498 [Candidatus Binatia bacterium]